MPQITRYCCRPLLPFSPRFFAADADFHYYFAMILIRFHFIFDISFR